MLQVSTESSKFWWQKCQGQNLYDCLNMPPVTLCNSLAITRNIAQPAKGSQVIDLYGDFEKLVWIQSVKQEKYQFFTMPVSCSTHDPTPWNFVQLHNVTGDLSQHWPAPAPCSAGAPCTPFGFDLSHTHWFCSAPYLTAGACSHHH